MPPTDRYTRQQGILSAERLAAVHATVIGVGAIGRQVALQLAAIGVESLQLIDPDRVEEVNLAPQGFWDRDVGWPKTQVVSDLCLMTNPTVEVVTCPRRFQRSMEVGNAIFCCVDSIETRGHIWRAVEHQVDFWVDGRMSAETMRILTAADPASRNHYPSTLFPAAEAHTGACTAKSTIYCANIAAGLMVAQLARWLRGMPTEADIQLNLLASELVVLSDGPSA